MRDRGIRRHQAVSHMRRRLKEDRNQHYDNLSCPCWTDKKAMARFKEQPQVCSCLICGNQRKIEGPTLQEIRYGQNSDVRQFDSLRQLEREESALSVAREVGFMVGSHD